MKKGTLLLGGCACFLIFALLCFPTEMLAASAEGVQLWDKGIPLLVSVSGCLRYPAAHWCGAADGCGSAPSDAALVSPAWHCRLPLLFRTSFRIPHGSKADCAAL